MFVLFLNSLFRDHVTNERFKSVDYTKQSSRQCLAEDWSWDEPLPSAGGADLTRRASVECRRHRDQPLITGVKTAASPQFPDGDAAD